MGNIADAIFFVGTEIEHTSQYGKLTLFVVGIQPIQQILKHATEQHVDHIYFGASQSFKIENSDEWLLWDHMIKTMLDHEYHVTVDFDVKYASETMLYTWHTYYNYIPMISVKLPHALMYGKHATLKIDDNPNNPTNSGVWCNNLHKLCSDRVKTSWTEYSDDIFVE